MGATVEGLSSRIVAASGSASIAGTASAITQEDGVEDTHPKLLAAGAASLHASGSGIRGKQRSHPPPVQACLMVIVRWLHPSESDLARTKQSRNERKMCHFYSIKLRGREVRYYALSVETYGKPSVLSLSLSLFRAGPMPSRLPIPRCALCHACKRDTSHDATAMLQCCTSTSAYRMRKIEDAYPRLRLLLLSTCITHPPGVVQLDQGTARPLAAR